MEHCAFPTLLTALLGFEKEIHFDLAMWGILVLLLLLLDKSNPKQYCVLSLYVRHPGFKLISELPARLCDYLFCLGKHLKARGYATFISPWCLENRLNKWLKSLVSHSLTVSPASPVHQCLEFQQSGPLHSNLRASDIFVLSQDVFRYTDLSALISKEGNML